MTLHDLIRDSLKLSESVAGIDEDGSTDITGIKVYVEIDGLQFQIRSIAGDKIKQKMVLSLERAEDLLDPHEFGRMH